MIQKLLLSLIILVWSSCYACPSQYTTAGSNNVCYPTNTNIDTGSSWQDCGFFSSYFWDSVVQTSTNYNPVDGSTQVNIICCGSFNPQIQSTTLIPGKVFTFPTSGTACDGSATNTAVMGVVDPSTVSNRSFTLQGVGSNINQSIHLNSALNYAYRKHDMNPLQAACNTISYLPEDQQQFFTEQCEKANYTIGSIRFNDNDDALICPSTNPPLICKLPITCALLCADKHCNNGNVVTAWCFFSQLNPSPPPFCCGTSMAPQNPTIDQVCVNNTQPAGCVPSDDAIQSNYFIPAVNVSFAAPSQSYVAIKNWCEASSTNLSCPITAKLSLIQPVNHVDYNCCPYGLPYSDEQCYICYGGDSAPGTAIGLYPHTIPQGSTDFSTSIFNSSLLSALNNMELIYANGKGELHRYQFDASGAPLSLYGVNLGQYCQLNYNMALDQETSFSSCPISDPYGNNMVITAEYNYNDSTLDNPDPDAGKLVVYEKVEGVAKKKRLGSVAIPSFPMPILVKFCDTSVINTADKFCVEVSFDAGNSMIFSGQITNDSQVSTSSAFALEGYLQDTSPKVKMPIRAIITDDYYNLTAVTTLYANNNPTTSTPPTAVCFDTKGNAVQNCSASNDPGGLWYISTTDSNGNQIYKYQSGGTKICYVAPSPVTPDNQKKLCLNLAPPPQSLKKYYLDCSTIQDTVDGLCIKGYLSNYFPPATICNNNQPCTAQQAQAQCQAYQAKCDQDQSQCSKDLNYCPCYDQYVNCSNATDSSLCLYDYQQCLSSNCSYIDPNTGQQASCDPSYQPTCSFFNSNACGPQAAQYTQGPGPIDRYTACGLYFNCQNYSAGPCDISNFSNNCPEDNSHYIIVNGLGSEYDNAGDTITTVACTSNSNNSPLSCIGGLVDVDCRMIYQTKFSNGVAEVTKGALRSQIVCSP